MENEDYKAQLQQDIDQCKSDVTKRLIELEQKTGRRVVGIGTITRDSSSPCNTSPLLVSIDITLK